MEAPAKLERVRVSTTKDNPSPLFKLAAPPSAKKTYTITLELTEEEMALVEEAQKVLSTSKVKDVLLGSAKKVVLGKRNLEKKRSVRAARKLEKTAATFTGGGDPCTAEEATRSTRYTAADVRHAVEQRDECQCTFVSADGTRCSETRWLQLDHIEPFALGGKSTLENLRLLCPAHNQLEAERTFGEATIRGLVRFKQQERVSTVLGVGSALDFPTQRRWHLKAISAG